MALTKQTIQTLSKGLVTERQELLFPEDASVDELNCVLEVDGRRRRRKGIVEEDGNVLSSFVSPKDELIYETTWENVGGIPNLEFLVIQTGYTLRFYSKSVVPVSSGEKSFTLNLNNFSAGNDVTIESKNIQGASLDGVFVVVHPGINPFYIEYNSTNDTISTSLITHEIRDFDFKGTISEYFEDKPEVSTSIERKYDTFNTGWSDTELNTYKSAKTAYPRLTHYWYSGKNSSGSFAVVEFDRVYTGNSLIGNGRVILNFFNKDRESIITGMGVEVENSRFKTVASFAGRFWYAGLEGSANGGKILFSKVIEQDEDYGKCYQENDPTSEDISDLLDNDGGVINIPEAFGIRKLFVIGARLIVFADNGVWSINGVDNVFKATEFSISKITSVGLVNEKSFVNAEGTPLWWSKTGIHTLTPNQVSGDLQEVDISEQTIQTFWERISVEKRLQTKAIYDNLNKQVIWFYPDNTETTDFKYNNLLVFNVSLSAFTPWRVSDQTGETSYIVGASFFSGLGSVELDQTVTVEGSIVTVGVDNVTIPDFFDVERGDTQVRFLIRDGQTGKLTFGLFDQTSFLDWSSSNYSSYVVPGYVYFDSLSLRKEPLYITTYFRITETGFISNGDGSFSLINPSGCLVKSYWDYRSSSSSSQQAYRLKRMPIVDENNLNSFPYGATVLINRTRLKGRGRVLNLRFESEQGKDFDMLGYEIIGNTNDGI